MKEGRQRLGYNIFIFLLILGLSLSSTPVNADPPHYDYDDAEVNLSTVKEYLNTTIDEMVSSMDNGLQVNYSQSYEGEVEGYSFGYIEISYNQTRFDLILEKEEKIYSDLVEIKDWSKEIEGEIPSYTYIERYFHPFFLLSENLISFSESH